MIKFILVVSLCIAGSHGQDVAAPGESAGQAEPYSYGYQTDTHAASEQRDPSGRVTGSYMLADADGRERRVEYYADETGFHAKVQTNELGTKSENAADVEVLASPPTEAQLYQSAVQQTAVQQNAVQQNAGQQFTSQVYGVQQVPQTTTVSLAQPQPVYTSNFNTQSVGYIPGSQYTTGYNYVPYGYGLNSNQYLNQGTYASYNNHLPAQYYRSIQTTGGTVQPGVWNSGVRYAQTGTVPIASGYQVAGYQTAPNAVSYTTSSVVPAISTGTVTTRRVSTSSSTGVPSSSFQILKSRR